MKARSIRFHLAAWYAAAVAAVAIGFAAMLCLDLRAYLENALLNIQALRARQIARTLVADVGRTGEAAMARQVAALYVPERSDRFIRITRSGAGAVYVSEAPYDRSFDPAAVAPWNGAPDRAEFRGRLDAGRDASLLVAGVRVGGDGRAGYLVEVGTSAAPVDGLFWHVLKVFALALPVVAVLGAAGASRLVRKALRPVDELAGRAEQITQHSLSERLPVVRTGDELERLSGALNRMITRLDDAFRGAKLFVADASHELRTPLTILRGELEALAQERVPPAALRDRLGSLLEEVDRLARIVERLLVLSRLDAGEAQAEGIRIDLAALAVATAGQMTLLAEDRRIELRCHCPAPEWVIGDQARLKQVVVNLIDNAIKYTAEGGVVTITVGGNEERAGAGAAGPPGVFLEVADTGVGIEADSLARVFDRFYRVESARGLHPEGSGLGLAIVKSICHAHGGDVDATSIPGRGSRFRVTLPAAAAE